MLIPNLVPIPAVEPAPLLVPIPLWNQLQYQLFWQSRTVAPAPVPAPEKTGIISALKHSWDINVVTQWLKMPQLCYISAILRVRANPRPLRHTNRGVVEYNSGLGFALMQSIKKLLFFPANFFEFPGPSGARVTEGPVETLSGRYLTPLAYRKKTWKFC